MNNTNIIKSNQLLQLVFDDTDIALDGLVNEYFQNSSNSNTNAW